MKRKNIFKSLLAAAMALIMIFGAAPLSGFVGIRLPMLSLKAEAATTEDGLFEYEVEENGTGSEYQCGVRITRYKGPDSGEVVIPKTIGGYEVKWIGSEWEDKAFQGCTGITSIVIPDSVISIDRSAFSGCTSLTEIVIPDSVTEIGNYAFDRCTSLSKVQLSNGLIKIGDYAFGYCKSLAEITIPDSVTEIGGGAFSRCSSLVDITVSPDNKNCVSVDGVLFSKDMSILLAYPAGNNRSTYTVPDSVTEIGNSAFSGCTSLKELTIPDSVTEMGNYAFYNCTSLSKVKLSNGLTEIGSFAFSDCKRLAEMTIPDSVTEIGRSAFKGCINLTDITVSPDNKNFSGVDGVLFSKDMSTLLVYPAGNKRSTYTIPDGVEIIYPEAFAHSKNLKSVTISESVTEIYESAFMCCTSLREITIPKSVIEIDDSAFENCDSLKNVYYLGTRAQWKAVVIGTKNEALTRATVHCIDDPPCDHVWSEWEVVEEATYEKEGLERRACSRCNIEETRVIPKLVRASAIELSESEKTVFVGDTFTITATVKPEDAFNRTVTWSSSDPSIATVDENGTVTAIAKGEAIITAESADGVKAECKVTVEKKDGFFKTLLKIITAPFRAIIYLFKKLFGK